MRRLFSLAVALFLAASIPAFATVFATVHGVVHDPQHRPIAGVRITLEATDSAFNLSTATGSEGTFELPQAPIGVYRLTVAAPGFSTVTRPLTIASGTNPVLHIPLQLAPAVQSIQVEGLGVSLSASDSATPTTLITRADIEHTPGADRTIGMEMITDYVPGAYMTHDMLHMRGGHQTSWLIDGIAIPNTKIASNVGPQIDPKDIDSIETQRGSYAADVGDRTYGVFNVLPRNGFERDREGELLLSGGNLGTGEAQLSLGDHSSKTAWYASLAGSRSNYGLATPVAAIYHDATNSESGLLNLIRNQTPKDQLRLNAQYRQDYFDVPYDPNPNDYESTSGYYSSYGLRDAQTERDSFLIANWVHTISPKALFSFAPFYHFNQADYDSLPTDHPVSTTWHQTSNYVGGQADAHLTRGRTASPPASTPSIRKKTTSSASRSTLHPEPHPNTAASAAAALVEFYLSDHLRLGRYITLLGGERFSIYNGGYDESATYPRIGATVEIPRLRWVLRGFYGHFFQPAPLLTVSSSVLNYASSLPDRRKCLHAPAFGARRRAPVRHSHSLQGLVARRGTCQKSRQQFLDHSNLGESNMYFPIAVRVLWSAPGR